MQHHSPSKGWQPALVGIKWFRQSRFANASHAIQADDADVLPGHGRLQLLHALRDADLGVSAVFRSSRKHTQQMRQDLVDEEIVAPAASMMRVRSRRNRKWKPTSSG